MAQIMVLPVGTKPLPKPKLIPYYDCSIKTLQTHNSQVPMSFCSSPKIFWHQHRNIQRCHLLSQGCWGARDSLIYSSLITVAGYISSITLKVRLHGTRQAARLARDILQCNLLRGNSVYLVSSCRARLLHIIHVSAVFGVGVLQRKLRQLLAIECAARQL